MNTFFRSKYDQYKHDTSQLVQWLFTAAQGHGLTLPSLRYCTQTPFQLDRPTRTAQQRRNAKKNIKKKAARKRASVGFADASTTLPSSDPAPAPDSKTLTEPDKRASTLPLSGGYLVTDWNMIEAAEHLVKHQVTVPVEVHKLVRRCICARLLCFHPLQRQDEVEAYVRSRLRFIGVLEEIEVLLHACPLPPATKPRCSVDSKTVAHERGPGVVRDQPHGAELPYKDLEDFPDIALPAPPRLSSFPPSQALYAVEEEEDEVFFYLLAFFSDLNNLRGFLRQTWSDYRDAKLSLVTASLVTNTAIELIRKTHDDVRTRYLPMFDHEASNLTRAVYAFVAASFGLDTSLVHPEQLGEGHHTEERIHEHLLVPYLCLLESCRPSIHGRKWVPVPQPRSCDAAEQNDRSAMTYKQRFEADKVLLLETLTDFTVMAALRIPMTPGSIVPVYIDMTPDDACDSVTEYQKALSIDEIACEIRRYIDQGELSLLTLFCVQIYVDINDVLQQESARGLDEYLRITAHMADSLTMRMQQEPQRKPPSWCNEDEDNVERFLLAMRSEDQCEFLRRRKVEIHRKLGHEVGEGVEVAAFFRRHPVYCGLRLYRAMVQYQAIGTALAESWGTVTGAAHLYAACRGLEDHDETSEDDGKSEGERGAARWPEMHDFIAMYGSLVFSGAVPQDVPGALQSLLLKTDQAVSTVETLVGSKPQTQADTSAPASRLAGASTTGRSGYLTVPTHISAIFKERYVGKDATTRLEIKTMHSLVDTLQRTGVNVASKTHASPKFSYVQLLETLVAGVEREDRRLRLDLVRLHLACFKVLRRMWEDLVIGEDEAGDGDGDGDRDRDKDESKMAEEPLVVEVAEAREGAREIGGCKEKCVEGKVTSQSQEACGPVEDDEIREGREAAQVAARVLHETTEEPERIQVAEIEAGATDSLAIQENTQAEETQTVSGEPDKAARDGSGGSAQQVGANEFPDDATTPPGDAGDVAHPEVGNEAPRPTEHAPAAKGEDGYREVTVDEAKDVSPATGQASEDPTAFQTAHEHAQPHDVINGVVDSSFTVEVPAVVFETPGQGSPSSSPNEVPQTAPPRSTTEVEIDARSQNEAAPPTDAAERKCETVQPPPPPLAVETEEATITRMDQPTTTEGSKVDEQIEGGMLWLATSILYRSLRRGDLKRSMKNAVCALDPDEGMGRL
ncbi:hypothetical protein ACQY0O_005302 [Thecaphora frezii]